MKRMVKNGDLIDVEPDGTITVAGKPVGGGGGGSDYTAGKNITISDTKEISLPDNINLLKSISFYGANESAKISLSSFDYELTILSDKYQNLPSLRLKAGTGITNRDVRVNFRNVGLEKIFQISFDLNGFNEGDIYPLISRSRIPDVPTSDGTYILKATVSNGTLTYSWIAG